MNLFIYYLPLMFSGLKITLASWFIASVLSLSIGTVIGICAVLYNRSWIGFIVELYPLITKGIPAYVQILLLYFVLPSLVPINLSAFSAGTIALGLCSAGYAVHIVKTSIQAIPQGQWEACQVLGYSTYHSLVRVIIPQGAVIALPMLLGELEKLLKSTSLLSAIGVIDLTGAGMNIVSRELTPLPIYGTIALIYLALSLLLTLLTSLVLRKFYDTIV